MQQLSTNRRKFLERKQYLARESEQASLLERQREKVEQERLVILEKLQQEAERIKQAKLARRAEELERQKQEAARRSKELERQKQAAKKAEELERQKQAAKRAEELERQKQAAKRAEELERQKQAAKRAEELGRQKAIEQKRQKQILAKQQAEHKRRQQQIARQRARQQAIQRQQQLSSKKQQPQKKPKQTQRRQAQQATNNQSRHRHTAQVIVRQLIGTSVEFGRNAAHISKSQADLTVVNRLLNLTKETFYQQQQQKVQSKIYSLRQKQDVLSGRYMHRLRQLCSLPAAGMQDGIRSLTSAYQGKKGMETVAFRVLRQHASRCIQVKRLKNKNLARELVSAYGRVLNP